PTGKCQQPGCTGQIVDGYCDTCGAPAGAKPAQANPESLSARIGTMSLGSARAGAGARRVNSRRTARAVGQLGAGYTTIPPEPAVDPASAILKNPEVPEDRRFCPHCGAEVGRSTPETPGRLEGYCPSCRKPYSFTPKLSPGDVVAGQYEVRGCLAHGGMGWVYLAQDRNVSNRWVVLKGLLNAGDEASMQAAMSEQRFLAQIQHPLIVEIYNFVTHEGGAYIVMEFVGGRSLKQVLKDRMAKAGGVYDPLPVDQALSYIIEILPAFTYLHARGLLYCDFKPDNLMHVEDSVKLIDMGGVRRIDDDDSVIFGTVGFQAPEVPIQGCSVASDIYTIGRTLLVCCAEVKGYQTTYATSLPPLDQTPIFLHHDSLYRLIAKACAPSPADRFSSTEELRYHMLGVLRETMSVAHDTPATTSAPSDLFEPPTVVSDAFTWKQLPRLRPEAGDPALVMLASLDPAMNPSDRLRQLLAAPTQTLEVKLATAVTAIDVGATDTLTATIKAILSRDPWEWRAAWIEGLAALNKGDWPTAQACFNAVLSQTPGELAPKFALGVACEMGGEADLAERLYHICAMTDAAYLPGAAFGLARIRSKRKNAKGEITDTGSVLAALDLVPATSSGWAQSRQLTAAYLTYSGRGIPDLAKAAEAVRSSTASTQERLRLELEIYRRALRLATLPTVKSARKKPVPAIGGVPVTKADIRARIEAILRQQASREADTTRRVALIDQANALRKWTLI
ncbi:MAG: protein kinase, partial [Propionibacteriaceae bacterium]|nr:protein kinase [Propionibacteriaceae bacterium]